MHLLIINCSPRLKKNSNTNLIINAFSEGYIKQNNTVEIYHLSEIGKWEEIRQAFYKNDNILMAIPLYVECIPGIMIEFLDTLSPKEQVKDQPKTVLSFILQGGFAEASQLRCGEQYLEKLPAFLNCDYGGTLIKGNMFITHMMPSPTANNIVAPFKEMGENFAQDGTFIKSKVDQFAAPEFFSKPYCAFFTMFIPFQKLFFHTFFKKKGCKGKLAAKPYQKYL